jgi:hypothetical protein
MNSNDSKYNNEHFRFSYLKIEDFISFALRNIGPIWLGRLYQSADLLLAVFNTSNTNTWEGIVDDILTWKRLPWMWQEL